EARRVLSYPGTLATHSLMCLVAVLGTAGTAYVSWLVARHKVFHVNLRWLLTTLNLILLTRSIGAFVRSAYYLLTLTSSNDCVLLWRVSRCTYFSEIVSKPVIVMSYAYLAIAIERLLALWLSKRYERSTNQALGIIGFIVVWIEYAIDFVRNIYHLITDDGTSSPFSVYCMSTSSVDMLVGFRLIPLSVISLSLFIGILVYVRVRNRAWMRDCNHSLTARFQERITYKATRLILPNAFIFCFMYAFSLMAAVFSSIVAHMNHDLLGSIMVKEVASLIFNTYSLIHPVIFVWLEPSLWQKEETMQRIEDRTGYNKTLAHTWEKTLKKRERKGCCGCFRGSRKDKYQRS
ncbi:hypothetical protein PENTCL1PPCAC_8211, partial [Pristionchus entomophagus]